MKKNRKVKTPSVEVSKSRRSKIKSAVKTTIENKKSDSSRNLDLVTKLSGMKVMLKKVHNELGEQIAGIQDNYDEDSIDLPDVDIDLYSIEREVEKLLKFGNYLKSVVSEYKKEESKDREDEEYWCSSCEEE